MPRAQHRKHAAAERDVQVLVELEAARVDAHQPVHQAGKPFLMNGHLRRAGQCADLDTPTHEGRREAAAERRVDDAARQLAVGMYALQASSGAPERRRVCVAEAVRPVRGSEESGFRLTSGVRPAARREERQALEAEEVEAGRGKCAESEQARRHDREAQPKERPLQTMATRYTAAARLATSM